jgi:Short C-terminal domain
MRRSMAGISGRGRGLIGTVARTAVIAGTASAVAGRVAQNREARKHQQQAQINEQVTETLAEQEAAPSAPAAPSDGGLSTESIVKLQQLGDLHKQGILTDEELAAQKAKILGT